MSQFGGRRSYAGPAVRFDVVGRPLPTELVVPPVATPGTIATDTLRAAGVDLTRESTAISSSLNRDLGNTLRLAAPPGAGAWVLP